VIDTPLTEGTPEDVTREMSRRLCLLVSAWAETGGDERRAAELAVEAGFDPDERVDAALAVGSRLVWVWLEACASLTVRSPAELWRAYATQTADERG
jgi:hypothetical protein